MKKARQLKITSLLQSQSPAKSFTSSSASGGEEYKNSRAIKKWTRVKSREQLSAKCPCVFDVEDDLQAYKRAAK